MPFINVKFFAGHSREKKARMAEKITAVVSEETGVPNEYIWVVFQDVDKADWSVGGTLCDNWSPKSDQ
ncbi:MAG: 4-oxalocrotonate tautomerase family protein [Negativicutes bacterium]|nr:4-oxalocrotonate tautomerase family protein [Negativicutes bacterium]